MMSFMAIALTVLEDKNLNFFAVKLTQNLVETCEICEKTHIWEIPIDQSRI